MHDIRPTELRICEGVELTAHDVNYKTRTYRLMWTARDKHEVWILKAHRNRESRWERHRIRLKKKL